jgi:hypothetical protein
MDPASTSLDQRYALILSKRRSRNRFPEGCVTIMESGADAISAADNDNNLYAAVVYGPSPSSEGLRIYYLVRWLT